MTWRAGRVVLYGCLTIAGVLYVIGDPTGGLDDALGWYQYVFIGCLALGSAMCLFGTLVDRWVGEFIGLPLVAAAIVVVAFALGAASRGDPGRLSTVFVLGGLVGVFAERWREIAQLAWISRDQHNGRES